MAGCSRDIHGKRRCAGRSSSTTPAVDDLLPAFFAHSPARNARVLPPRQLQGLSGRPETALAAVPQPSNADTSVGVSDIVRRHLDRSAVQAQARLNAMRDDAQRRRQRAELPSQMPLRSLRSKSYVGARSAGFPTTAISPSRNPNPNDSVIVESTASGDKGIIFEATGLNRSQDPSQELDKSLIASTIGTDASVATRESLKTVECAGADVGGPTMVQVEGSTTSLLSPKAEKTPVPCSSLRPLLLLPRPDTHAGTKQSRRTPCLSLHQREAIVASSSELVDIHVVRRANKRREKVMEQRRHARDLQRRFRYDAPTWMLPPANFDDLDDFDAQLPACVPSPSFSQLMSPSFIDFSCNSNATTSGGSKRNEHGAEPAVACRFAGAEGPSRDATRRGTRAPLPAGTTTADEFAPSDDGASTSAALVERRAASGLEGVVSNVAPQESIRALSTEVVGTHGQRVQLQRIIDARVRNPAALDAEVRVRRLPQTSAYMHLISSKRQQQTRIPSQIPETFTAKQRRIVRESLGLQRPSSRESVQCCISPASDVVSAAVEEETPVVASRLVDSHLTSSPVLSFSDLCRDQAASGMQLESATHLRPHQPPLQLSPAFAPFGSAPTLSHGPGPDRCSGRMSKRASTDSGSRIAAQQRTRASTCSSSNNNTTSTPPSSSSSTSVSDDDSDVADLAAEDRVLRLRRLRSTVSAVSVTPASSTEPLGPGVHSAQRIGAAAKRRLSLAEMLHAKGHRRTSTTSIEHPFAGASGSSALSESTLAAVSNAAPRPITADVSVMHDSAAPLGSSLRNHTNATAAVLHPHPESGSDHERRHHHHSIFALPSKFIRYASNTTTKSLILGSRAGDARSGQAPRHTDNAVHVELVFRAGCSPHLDDVALRQMIEPHQNVIAGFHFSDRGGRFVSLLCDELLQGLKAAAALLTRVRSGRSETVAEAYIAPRCGIPDAPVMESPRVFDMVGPEMCPCAAPDSTFSLHSATQFHGNLKEDVEWCSDAVSRDHLKASPLSVETSSPRSPQLVAEKPLTPPDTPLRPLSTSASSGMRHAMNLVGAHVAELAPGSDSSSDATALDSGTAATVAAKGRRERMLHGLAEQNLLGCSPSAHSLSSPKHGQVDSSNVTSLSPTAVTPKAWGVALSNLSATTSPAMSLPATFGIASGSSKSTTPTSRTRTVNIVSPHAIASRSSPGQNSLLAPAGSAAGRHPRRRRGGRQRGGEARRGSDDGSDDDDEPTLAERTRDDELLQQFDSFTDELLIRSNRIAIIVAVSQFEDELIAPLPLAAYDAAELSALLEHLGYVPVIMAVTAPQWFLRPTAVNVVNVVQKIALANGSGARSNAGGGSTTSHHPVTAVFVLSRGYVGPLPGADAHCEVALASDSMINDLSADRVILPANLATLTDATGKHPLVFVDTAPISQHPLLLSRSSAAPTVSTSKGLATSNSGQYSKHSQGQQHEGRSASGASAAAVPGATGGSAFAWLTSHIEEGGNEMLVLYPRNVSCLATYYLRRALEGRALANNSLHLSANAVLWYLNGKLQNRGCRVQHNAIVSKPHSVFFSMFVFPASVYSDFRGLVAHLQERDADEFVNRVRLNVRLRCRVADGVSAPEHRYSLRLDRYMWVRHFLRHAHSFVYPRERKVKLLSGKASKLRKHVDRSERLRVACTQVVPGLLGVEYANLADLMGDAKRTANFSKDFTKLNMLCKQFELGQLSNFFGEGSPGASALPQLTATTTSAAASQKLSVRERFRSIVSIAGAASSLRRKPSLAAAALTLVHANRRRLSGAVSLANSGSEDEDAVVDDATSSRAAQRDVSGATGPEDEEQQRSLEHLSMTQRDSVTDSFASRAECSSSLTMSTLYQVAQGASRFVQAATASVVRARYVLTSGLVVLKLTPHGGSHAVAAIADFVMHYFRAAAAKKTPKGATPVVMFRRALSLHYYADVALHASQRDLRKLDRMRRQQPAAAHFVIDSIEVDPFDSNDHAIVERVQAVFRGHMVRRVMAEQREVTSSEAEDRAMIVGHETRSGAALFASIYCRRIELCGEEEFVLRGDVWQAEHDERKMLMRRGIRFLTQQEGRLRRVLVASRDVEFMPLRERGIRIAIMELAQRYFRSSFALHWFATGVFWDRYYLQLQLYQELLTLRSNFKHRHRELDLKLGKVEIAPLPPSSFEGGHSVIRQLIQRQHESGRTHLNEAPSSGSRETTAGLLPADSMLAFSIGSASAIVEGSVVFHFGESL